ncbi:tRNA uracil 4-sulfurtransferase ThiI [Brevibacillus massiliensis]|jgi:thiamine biosynthesis protein ThiI|uniref:tRNA uracil 4-sulfurtransferase ThiI n=1 Tax=Brevibacillus massiliensis TaxID=1118054 RepID=UPI000305FE56|nr:tRNA uracil 4-sulfurtransferase ThiI [Brevibacillus massiliensis]
MEYDAILIRYGELALKGRNREVFEETLLRSVKSVLKEFRRCRVWRNYGRMYVELNGESAGEISERLQRIFGITSLSPTIKVEANEEAIKQGAEKLITSMSPPPATFRVETRRADKRFPLQSMEVSRLVGGHILKNVPGIKVDLHQPQATISIEIRTEGTFLSTETLPGAGGLPVGTAGKVLLLLSGGIDSPVAGWSMMKRGVTLEAVHFYSYPFTSERSLEKVRDLAHKLTKWGGSINLHVVPFTEIQTSIREHCPEDYTITIMRRFMMRIAERIAAKTGALALATGESLGQVASQTLESMNTINSVVNIPILRPLVASDKTEITEIAKRIDTFELSILPYEDCCTIFTPKNPVTRPRPEMAGRYEEKLDIENLVSRAVEQTAVEVITTQPRGAVADLF